MVRLTGKTLTVMDVVNVARYNHPVELDDVSMQEVSTSYNIIVKKAQEGVSIYGVTTGFGSFSTTFIGTRTAELSRNLVTSHACATGEELPCDVVRATMVIRVNALLNGRSGVNPNTLRVLVDMLNKGVTPVVPSQGSLGSSGDLCLLAHIALVYSKPVEAHDSDDNDAFFEGQRMSGKEAMRKAGIERISLGPKEGLAVTNGATATAAIACLLIHDAWRLLHNSSFAFTLSCEALMAVPGAFDERIHKARNQVGQQKIAKEIRRLICGSELINPANRQQDPYSIRCHPQIVGGVYDCLKYVEDKIVREINAVTDNPLVFGDDDTDVISGGNFHGQHLGFLLDYLKICLTAIGNVSERRQARLLDPNLSNGLPAMLVTEDPGCRSGYMIGQYTSASHALECRQLSSPDSVHSLPTSANQEDHNANCTTSALHVCKVVEHVRYVIAVELIMAARGIDIRKMVAATAEKKLSPLAQQIYHFVRNYVPFVAPDHKLSTEIEGLYRALCTEDVLKNDAVKKNDTRFKLDIPRGTRDFFPTQMRVRNEIIRRISEVFERHGGVPLDTPIFELSEILLGKYGEEGGKLVFDLMDQGDQRLTMRYDLTVPFARFVAMHGITEMKRYHIGPVFRRDNPSEAQGRFRQFYQCDFDIAGKSLPMVADAEIISIFINVLKVCEMDFFVKINDRRLLDLVLQDCGVHPDNMKGVWSAIDKLDKLPWEPVRDELLQKGNSTATVDRMSAVVCLNGPVTECLPKLRNQYASNPAVQLVLDEIELLHTYLCSYGVADRTVFDMSLARGLDYYTGVIFEATLLDNQNRIGSIGAGGRYDGLIGMFSQNPIPAVGCSIGIERVFASMEAKHTTACGKDGNICCLVVPIGKTVTDYVIKIVTKLRSLGITSEFQFEAHKMKHQIEYAINHNAKFMLIVGDDEKASNSVTVKDVASQKQTKISFDDIGTYFAHSRRG